MAVTVNNPITAGIIGPNTAPVSTSTILSSSTYSISAGTIVGYTITYSTATGEFAYANSSLNGNIITINWDINPRVYKLTVSYTNPGACAQTASIFISVYDPSGGFVTGGGSIDSPPGALISNPDAAGEAKFGLVSKFDKNGKVTGNTDFEFSAGAFYFKSISHDDGSLVIDNARATYRGTGYIKDPVTGAKITSEEYKFMVSAYDPQVNGSTSKDRYRIKITNKTTGALVYDNLVGAEENAALESVAYNSTELISGSIVIHKPTPVKGGSTSSKLITEAKPALEQQSSLYNYPNSFSDRTTIAFSLDKEESFALEVYDVKGALVKKVSMGMAEANKLYEFDVDGRSMAEGIYIARLVTSSRSQSIKLILKK
ncbi:T9SS type A sorting domain-containing protein [Pontibacter sp. SD6]|uniref:T9SS type A sorting domain-containing protein n=1 Tax=Pontibacter cellulosilyticus TaxID=1720253 RepID=A0A923SHJ4_9BACT|nr:T9SS type A sorting domain-containing protein [Pontibacter cellulosilyticus]MBC5991809.1 T9SS type A sorting domain-containing protein [Pontibacter cellulosilyticus]